MSLGDTVKELIRHTVGIGGISPEYWEAIQNDGIKSRHVDPKGTLVMDENEVAQSANFKKMHAKLHDYFESQRAAKKVIEEDKDYSTPLPSEEYQ
ncbi:MAG: hypothetical protein ABIB43_06285 [archaeon]